MSMQPLLAIWARPSLRGLIPRAFAFLLDRNKVRDYAVALTQFNSFP
jgi:hypothetical protein